MRLTLVALALLAITFASRAFAADADRKLLNVLVLVGGHDYDKAAFPKTFQGNPDIKVTEYTFKDHSEVFEDISDWKYDVVVFYSMTQKISEKRQQNFLKLLDRGVGMVFLHHVICQYQDWPEFARIVGGKYLLKEQEIDGKKMAPSKYLHDVNVAVKIKDPNHPITRGLKDFTVHDETYKGQWIDPSVTLLLTTDEPTSDSFLGWCKTYGNARTCYIQLGHGPQAFVDANYQKLVANAIRWVAGR